MEETSEGATEEGSLSQDRPTCKRCCRYRTEQQNHILPVALAENLIEIIKYNRSVDPGDDWVAPVTSPPPPWPVPLVDPPLKIWFVLSAEKNNHFYFKPSSFELWTFIILQSEAQTPNWGNKKTKTCFLTGGDFKIRTGVLKRCSALARLNLLVFYLKWIYTSRAQTLLVHLLEMILMCVGACLVKWIWEYLCIFYALLSLYPWVL